MTASRPIGATRAQSQTRPSNLNGDDALTETPAGASNAVLVDALTSVKSFRSRGGLSSLETLQDGRGMPAPPQPQAVLQAQGRKNAPRSRGANAPEGHGRAGSRRPANPDGGSLRTRPEIVRRGGGAQAAEAGS
jgi:hypothetical protein